MAGEDPVYEGRVVGLRCAAPPGITPCVGEVQCHHRSTGRVGRPAVKGRDRRAHSHDSIPLCLGHHGEWHANRGTFDDMDKVERMAWETDQVELTQKKLGLVTPYEVA